MQTFYWLTYYSEIYCRRKIHASAILSYLQDFCKNWNSNFFNSGLVLDLKQFFFICWSALKRNESGTKFFLNFFRLMGLCRKRCEILQYERFFRPGETVVMSTYAPITFPPAPVLVFQVTLPACLPACLPVCPPVCLPACLPDLFFIE